MKRILVLHAQVPFVKGGAEFLVEGLVEAINQRLEGVEAELVMLPFQWNPEEQILSDIIAWRCIDLTSSAGKNIDLVIGTKFPSYAAKHPNKITWLVHQHRLFYDLEGSDYDKYILSENELTVRNTVRASDTKVLNESKAIFTIANTVSDRLKKYNRLNSTPVFPPSALANKIYSGRYEDYVVCFARLDRLKRQDLLVEAGRLMRSNLKIKIVGRGDTSYQNKLTELIEQYKLEDRVQLLGYLEEEQLLETLANSRAVYYGPLDEDYGYATIEGFLAKKPVITLNDSGEVARLVNEYGSGWVLKPEAKAIAKCLDDLNYKKDKELNDLALAGYEHAKGVTWDNVLNQLVKPFL